MKKTYLKIAGIINLLTAVIHLIAGQMDLVNPLHNSNLEMQEKAEWLGAWHMITILLFLTSFLILKAGFNNVERSKILQLKAIGWFYILAGIPFVVASIHYSVFAPQWILLLAIGGLLMIGLKKLDADGH